MQFECEWITDENKAVGNETKWFAVISLIPKIQKENWRDTEETLSHSKIPEAAGGFSLLICDTSLIFCANIAQASDGHWSCWDCKDEDGLLHQLFPLLCQCIFFLASHSSNTPCVTRIRENLYASRLMSEVLYTSRVLLFPYIISLILWDLKKAKICLVYQRR